MRKGYAELSVEVVKFDDKDVVRTSDTTLPIDGSGEGSDEAW